MRLLLDRPYILYFSDVTFQHEISNPDAAGGGLQQHYCNQCNKASVNGKEIITGYVVAIARPWVAYVRICSHYSNLS